MHIHRLEKIWLIFGTAMLIVFLAVVGVGAFALGMEPPGGHRHTINPEQVQQIEPFNEPGLKKISNNLYEANVIAYSFGYAPTSMEIPLGATVYFQVTSTDVVHGFQIVGTNINMMAIPGEVNHATQKFTEPGEYLVICNEYCGIAHEAMMMKIIVK